MKNARQHGFHIVPLLAIIATISLIGLLGYRAYQARQTKDTGSSQTAHVEDGDGLNTSSTLECLPRGHDNYRSNNTLAIDPNNENILYIAVELKGIFKSIDGGATWKQSDYGIKGYAKESDPTQKCIQEFGRLLIDPRASNHLLLSRVESPGTDTMPFSENAGLWESKDAGATWKQLIKPGMNMSGSKAIAFAPNDSSTIYYGVNNGRPSYLPPNEPYDNLNETGVLYVSRDGGKNWQELPTGAEQGLRTASVHVDKTNPNKIWLLTMTQSADGEGTASPDLQKGPLLTTDGGRTWQSFGAKLPENARPILSGTMNPADSRNVHVTGAVQGGVSSSFVTFDDGATWRLTSRSMYFVSYDSHDPTGRRLLGYDPFTNPAGLYESTDKGLTWRFYSALPAEVNHRTVRAESIVFAPKTAGTIYMNGSYGYVWKSTDNGKTWQPLMTIDSIGGPNRNKDGSTTSRNAH